ncbi:hypothetical protein E4T47_03405 [Aureobasidium subglaciale]|nr:hypothetical protein E4T47_03405 [Aureobasidium subglaciale]
MDNPLEPMPKVSIDPLPPAAESHPSSPPSPPPPEQLVVTSHEGSVVAVPAAESTLEKAVTPPASEPRPPSPPPAPPVVIIAHEPLPPPSPSLIAAAVDVSPPASPVIAPIPVVVQQVEPISTQTTHVEAPPAPIVVSTPSSPSVSPRVIIESPTPMSPAPASPVIVAAPSSTTPAPIVPLAAAPIASIQRVETTTQGRTDRVPVLVASKSSPELQQEAHEVRARPSFLSFRSMPSDTFIRRDTHVVVVDPVDEGSHPKRHWRDKVRKFWVSKLGGRLFLRFLLGEQGSNVATAVVSRY